MSEIKCPLCAHKFDYGVYEDVSRDWLLIENQKLKKELDLNSYYNDSYIKSWNLLEHSEQEAKKEVEKLREAIKSAMSCLEIQYDVDGNSLKNSDAWDYLEKASEAK